MNDEPNERLLARIDVIFGLLQTEFSAPTEEIMFAAFVVGWQRDPAAAGIFLQTMMTMQEGGLSDLIADIVLVKNNNEKPLLLKRKQSAQIPKKQR